MPFGAPCRSACTIVESSTTWKQAILLEWHALSQRFIDGSINQWRRRLQGVVQENGGHIEHVVQLAVDICTLVLLFVADVIRDEHLQE